MSTHETNHVLGCALGLSALLVVSCASNPQTPTDRSTTEPRTDSPSLRAMTRAVAAGAGSDYPEYAEVQEVPNCNGKMTRPPLWLTRIPIWGALCVRAPSKGQQVEIGTHLIAHKGIHNGDAALYQVYYSLEDKSISPNEWAVVWAVCGGKGINLKHGDRVIPSGKLPKRTTDELAKYVNILVAMDDKIKFDWRLLRNSSVPADRSDLEKEIEDLDDRLTDAAVILRGALIKENQRILGRQPAQKKGPLSPSSSQDGIPIPQFPEP